MPNYLLTLHYSDDFPGRRDTTYVVENQPDPIAARIYLKREVIGYDPGVRITSEELPIRKEKP